MRDDLRITWRQLRRTPAYVGAAVCSLTVGLAVCLAVFSVLTATLVGEAPGIPDRSSLTQVRWSGNDTLLTESEWDGLAPALGATYTSVAAEGVRRLPVLLPRGATTLTTAFVSDRYFQTLGTTARMGRLLDVRDAVPGPPLAAVIGARTWHDEFAGAGDVLGRTISAAGWPVTIVGVTPEGMSGLTLHDFPSADDAPQMWLSLASAGSIVGSSGTLRWLSPAGRLRPGVSLTAARAVVDTIGTRLRAESSDPPGATLRSLLAWRAGFDWQDAPWDALLAVLLFLFVPLGLLGVGCLNVVNLQLARAMDRSSELGIRVALGASRARLVRLLVVESAVVAAVAAVPGVLGAWALLPLAQPFVARPIVINGQVLGLCLTLVTIAILCAGLVPAWLATRRQLPGGDARHEPLRYRRLRAGLVVAQVAASTILVFLSGLGVQALRTRGPIVPPDASRRLVADFALQDLGYTEVQAGQFVRQALDELRGDPTIAAAGFADFFRFDGQVRIARPGGRALARSVAVGGYATADWFAASGIPLIAGRLWTGATNERAVVVSASLAAILASSPQAALGTTLQAAHGHTTIDDAEVVGVVGDSLEDQNGRAVPMILLPMPPTAPTSLVLIARTSDRAGAAVQLRGVLARIAPNVSWVRMDTLEDRLSAVFRGYREMVWLGAALGGLGLALAATGLFALMAYSVRRRTREFGIRLALGAPAVRLAGSVIGQGVRLVALGLAASVAVAIPLAHLLRSALFGLSPVDPVVVTSVTGLLLGIAVAACLLPARRAARVSPAVALRQE
jgi:putative ABC transport system permease protein